MARKGENIYKRKDGRWEGRYRMNNPLTDGNDIVLFMEKPIRK